MNADESHLAFSLFEYAGIPGTIICGWMASRFFAGRCAPVNVIAMLMVLVGILCYWQADTLGMMFGSQSVVKWIVYISLSITGFALYGPIALIGIQTLSFVPKNAAGTAAGFVALFGYLFGDAVLSKIVIGQVAGNASLGWGVTFWMFIVAAVLSILICAVTWRREYDMMQERMAQGR